MPISAPITLLTPFRRQLELLVTQAPGGEFSHDGDLYYGWDFATTSGSLFGEEVLAIAGGTVVFVEESVPDGDPASGSFGDDGSERDPSLGPAGALGNVVTVEHVVDGQVFYASYLHLAQNSVPLEVGSTVSAGQVIGLLGNTGVRTGTHLHLNIGETLGNYTNGSGQEFPAYQIAEGPGDGGSLLAVVDFIDSPISSGELTVGDTFTSSTVVISADAPDSVSGPSEASAIFAGTFLARVSYGGQSNGETDLKTGADPEDQMETNYFYDYQGYLDTLTPTEQFGDWQLLRPADLPAFVASTDQYFSAGGLYIARPDISTIFEDENLAEALLAETTVDGVRTLVLSFRGSDGEDAAFEAQTWTGAGIAAYYNALRPLVEAAREYAVSNGINNVVVSGHSLGGSMADTFTLVDARSFLDLDINLTVVSLASAGVDVDLPSYLTVDAEFADTDWVASGGPGSPPKQIITSLNSPAFHHDLSHADDRVRFPEFFDGETDGLTFNDVLTFNRHFQNEITINLPNLGNLDVEYPPDGGPGFGALHNDELYWVNWYSILTDPLFDRFTGSQNVIIGISDYNRAPDLDGSSFSIFRDYTGLSAYGVDNDQSARALSGDSSSNTSDFILGLTGNDQLFGYGGADLLSGGEGDDAIFGDAGADILGGGSGTDRLVGGSGGDIFFFQQTDYPLFASVNPDRITDYNQGNTGAFSASEGDLIDLSGFQFATSTGFGTASTVRLRSIEASGGLPEGAILEVNTGDGIWRGLARLDNVTSGQSVQIALTDTQSTARTGTEFVVDGIGDGTTWSVSPGSQNVAEGDVTISFTITRSGGSLEAKTVYVSTVQTHGSYNDGDYVGRTNVAVLFATGVTTETFTVQINADAFTESDETFGLLVQADPNDDVSKYHASATFTIEDGSTPSVSGDTYFGDDLDNTWSGASSADLAFGNGGNDTLDGRGGNDILFGGDGNDSIDGGTGADVIVTGAGANYVDAGSGNDFIETLFSIRHDQTILGGDGDDTLIARSVNGGSRGLNLLSVNGGSGTDTLVVEANEKGFVHRFVDPASATLAYLEWDDSFADIQSAINGVGNHRIESGLFAIGTFAAQLEYINIESIEYRGSSGPNLFLDWEGTATAIRGGIQVGGSYRDALFADWSATTADIVWNLTVDNDTEKTLGNGVTVQSIERVMLQTGSGDDNLVLGSQSDHVETSAGNDIVVVGGGSDEVDAGTDDDRISVIEHGLHSVDGGSGDDLLRIDLAAATASNSSLERFVFSYGNAYGLTSSSAPVYVASAASSLETIEAAIASGQQLYVVTYWNGGGSGWGSNRSVEVSNIETLELVGGDANDFFVDGPGYDLTLAAGGLGTDALYADWSATTADIVWNLTVDNDTEKTLGNGVVVQSIERAMLRTGSGDDTLVLGRSGGEVAAGSGNDVIDIRGAKYISAGSFAAHLVTVTSAVDAGDDDDLVFAGGETTGNAVVDGGAGFDQLTIDLSDTSSQRVYLRWTFETDGFESELDAFEAAVASGDPLRVYTAYLDNNYITSWIDISNFEGMHYRGGAYNDVFFGNADLEVLSARGGGGTDTLYADWSATSNDIVWNLTVDNDTEKTLGNGVVVQSIERAMLRTGSGDDTLVLGRSGGEVAAGSGNDVIDIRGAKYISAGSFAAHLVTVTSAVDAGDDDDLVFAGGETTGNAVVDGGAGFDQLTIDLSDTSSQRVYLRWTFETDGFESELDAFEAAVASGDPLRVYTAYLDNNYITSWIDISNFEGMHYRGGAYNDVFFGNADLEVLSARGGGGTDTLYADWSATSNDIVWNLTVDNDTEKTLGNGVVVQSIERAMLRTGSGDDTLVLGRSGGEVAAGSGNDVIDIRGAKYISAGSFAAHLVTVTSAVDAGDDDDLVFAGGETTGNAVVDGGAGFDQLTIDLSDTSSQRVYLRWTFETDGFESELDAFEAAVASGDPLRVYTAYLDNNYITSWIDISNFEGMHYRGGAYNDVFFGNADLEVLSARGGGGTDTLYADWSATSNDIVWNLTVDNDTEKTLGNGVVVQSIERAMLRTGSGDDTLVLGSQSDHVETGSGNDVVTTGFGNDFVDAGSGNDQVVFAGLRSDFSITTTDGVTTVIGATGTDTLVDVEELVFDDKTISLVLNLPPTASAIDAGTVAENDGEVTIDLLGDAGTADSDGGTLGVANVSVTDQNGAVVAFGLTGAALAIDPTQFATTLAAGESAVLTVVYDVTDGQGGLTPNTGQLVVDGLDGPFTWYLDGDADGFGVDDAATNQTAYAAPAGTSDVAGDADDSDATVYPGAPEINDGKDNDQDGATDEDNTAPTANADSYSVKSAQVLTVATASGLLANDTDADGDPLLVQSITAPTNGTLNIATDGSFTYSPDAGFVGQELLTYTLSDGAETTTGEVTINVENAAPVANDDNYTIDDGEVLTVAAGAGLLANDTDADGDPLLVQSITAPTNGTLNIATDGSFTYTPDAGFVGQELLTYTITDGTATETGEVTIDITEVTGPNVITGGTSSQVEGTDDADLIQPNAGVMKTAIGGGGADVFDFADTVHNGAREFRTVLDYAVGEDFLEIGDGQVIHHVVEDDRVLLFIDQDFDVLTVVGASSLSEIEFV